MRKNIASTPNLAGAGSEPAPTGKYFGLQSVKS